jgi:hypothetical protein
MGVFYPAEQAVKVNDDPEIPQDCNRLPESPSGFASRIT